MFELMRFGCNGAKRCRFDCGGPSSCRVTANGTLDQAIRAARELLDEDPLNVVEVRRNGVTLCTVGAGWVSRKAPPPVVQGESAARHA